VGRFGLVLLTAPRVALAALVMFQSVRGAEGLDPVQAAVALALFASGPLSYFLFRRATRPGDASLAAEEVPQ
jgi:hypothetical protein